eukprot:scaffold11854_cov104-Isochrysis_galbana.AAC.1
MKCMKCGECVRWTSPQGNGASIGGACPTGPPPPPQYSPSRHQTCGRAEVQAGACCATPSASSTVAHARGIMGCTDPAVHRHACCAAADEGWVRRGGGRRGLRLRPPAQSPRLELPRPKLDSQSMFMAPCNGGGFESRLGVRTKPGDGPEIAPGRL